MTEERSKRREFLPLVFIVNRFKKPLLIKLKVLFFLLGETSTITGCTIPHALISFASSLFCTVAVSASKGIPGRTNRRS